MLNFFRNLSPIEIGVIVVIVVVLFGPKAMKKFGKMSGETLKEVKNIKKNFSDAVDGVPNKEGEE